jgi:hypothetical protein
MEMERMSRDLVAGLVQQAGWTAKDRSLSEI